MRQDGNESTDWHARAAERLARHGRNLLPPPKKRGPLLRFLLQFHNVLIHVLLAAAVVTAALGHWVDSGVILGVVVINALIGFIQEGKAEAALEAIRAILSPRAQVLRDGRRQEIEEAALTGESVPVEKQVEPVPADASLGDRASMAWSGTLVTYGQGAGVVTATGAATEIGRISRMLSEVQALATPLLRQMAVFGQWLTWVILAVAGATFAYGVLLGGYGADAMFLAAVGLAAAAIPEGLPAILTITLAIGVRAMARRNAIVRRLPAVEALGSVTVICSDKTGTLTRNEMTVQSVIGAGAVYAVSGVGYAPDGGFSLDGREVAPETAPELLDIARLALLCNDAVLTRQDGQWMLAGNPTEGALVTLGLKAGLDAKFEAEALPRGDVIPFESEHRFMATLHHDHAGHGFILLKGAPERVMELCAAPRRQRPAPACGLLARGHGDGGNRAGGRQLRLHRRRRRGRPRHLRQHPQGHRLHPAHQRRPGGRAGGRHPAGPAAPADHAGADPLGEHGHRRHPGPGLRTGRGRHHAAAAVNLLLMGEVFYLFNCRRSIAPVLDRSGFTGNRWVLLAIAILLGLQALFTYWPPMQGLFRTAALDAATWGHILVFGVLVFFAVELEKAAFRRRGRG